MDNEDAEEKKNLIEHKDILVQYEGGRTQKSTFRESINKITGVALNMHVYSYA